MNKLKGIHHVTAITSDAQKIYTFFTSVLGMRMVKKNVNQDDLTTYHLYFGDDRGNPGSAMTFFDFKGIPAHKPGTDDISKTTFRVKNDAALSYWLKRFDHYKIDHNGIETQFGRKMIHFKDFDNQSYGLISDEGLAPEDFTNPWLDGPVPNQAAILGLGPVYMSVSQYPQMHEILTRILKMTHTQTEDIYHLYTIQHNNNNGSIVVVEDMRPYAAQLGYGGVHHVAFRIEDLSALYEWEAHFDSFGLRHSGYVDRAYFKSLYTRIYPNILFELATDGPGFIDDEEDYEHLGQTLTLPPHLRDKRTYIEQQLKPFSTPTQGVVVPKEEFK